MLLARVLRTIEAHRLLAPGDRVLVAISGGSDSTALLHALRLLRGRLAIELEAATVDHGLRPGSAQEHERVRAHVEASGVRCVVIALGLAPGPSMQARAREARYAALTSLARERNAGAIAVAHTRDDQAETVLARILRGSGLRGLAGALRRRDDGVVRPLLDCDRALVRGFLEERGLAPLVEDPSNRSPGFLRTRVRHTLLPALAAEQPEIRATLARLAEDADEHRALVEELAGPPERAPEIASLAASAPPVRRERLRRWAALAGAAPLGRAHLEQLERAVLTARGAVRLPRARVATIEGGRLVASGAHPETPAVVEGAAETSGEGCAPRSGGAPETVRGGLAEEA